MQQLQNYKTRAPSFFVCLIKYTKQLFMHYFSIIYLNIHLIDQNNFSRAVAVITNKGDGMGRV